MGDICIHAIVEGKVQGVGFRDSTRAQAEPMGITGHAKNRPDGSVEVLACGDDDAVERLIKWLHSGPPSAHVTNVTVSDRSFNPPRRFTTG